MTNHKMYLNCSNNNVKAGYEETADARAVHGTFLSSLD